MVIYVKKEWIEKHRAMVPLTLVLIMLVAFFGFSNGNTTISTASADFTLEESTEIDLFNDSAPVQQYGSYLPEDLDDSWDERNSTSIVLTGNSARVSGGGASVSGSNVKITTAGTYILSGVLNDGQILIDAKKNDIVRIVLNGVSLSNSTSAPFYSAKAGKTIIILADGTENYVVDAYDYVYEGNDDEPDAAIFVKDNLTITGSGSLYVTGNFNNGIGAKDDLCITDGNIFVAAVNDGIRGRDSVSILGGVFVIESQNDGLKSNNEEQGIIMIDGGQFKIAAANDGIQAETVLYISGGSFDITTGGGAAAAPVIPAESWFGGRNMQGGAVVVTEDSESKKALKAGNTIIISGGEFLIDCEDDAVHSNGDVTISGGRFTISTGDDAIHADNALRIEGGVINILTSYEGLEGLTIDIIGGDIKLKSLDDGINASDGSSTGGWGMMGGGRSAAGNGISIRISGGSVEIESGGDGIDSNGTLSISGGLVVVSGSATTADAALDADLGIEISGGVVIAAGSSSMLEIPRTSSTQSSIVVYYSSNQASGTEIRLTDEDGNTIASYTPTQAYQSVIISAPQLEINKKYTLYSNNTMKFEHTLTSIVTIVSDNGSAVNSRGGFGSMPGQRW